MPFQPVRVSFIMAGLVSSTYAAAILDQRNDDPNALSNPGLSLFFPNLKQAQTFTVGITGTLVQLDIYMAAVGALVNAPVLDIRRLSGAQPSDNPSDVLASQSIPTSKPPSAPAFVSFAFSVPVFAGEQLAFVISQPNGPVGDFRLLPTFSNTIDFYPRGSLWTNDPGFFGGNWYPNGNSTGFFDVGFRTFVDPVPEPSTFTFLAAGLTVLGFLVKKIRL